MISFTTPPLSPNLKETLLTPPILLTKAKVQNETRKWPVIKSFSQTFHQLIYSACFGGLPQNNDHSFPFYCMNYVFFAIYPRQLKGLSAKRDTMLDFSFRENEEQFVGTEQYLWRGKIQFTNKKWRDLFGIKSCLIEHFEMICSNVHNQIFAGILSSAGFEPVRAENVTTRCMSVCRHYMPSVCTLTIRKIHI